MRIEPPATSEADDVVDLWVALARSQRGHGSHLHDESNRVRAREAIVGHAVTGSLFVAYDPDPVGFIMFEMDSGTYAQDVTRGVVQNVYVRPDRRREGVGSALLSAAEDALAAEGADVVSLEALADNDGARRFYRRHGYEPHRVELEKRVESDTKEAG